MKVGMEVWRAPAEAFAHISWGLPETLSHAGKTLFTWSLSMMGRME